MSTETGSKCALIGIDAGDIGCIHAWLDRLPVLRSLLAGGSHHALRSSPELTSSIWPSFTTGAPAGEHGVYYPLQWSPAEMRLRRLAADQVGREPFWLDLARHGVRTVAVDVPFRMRGVAPNGIEVSSWGTQECLAPLHASRPGLVREIRARFGRHPMGRDVPSPLSTARLRRATRDLVDGVRQKARLLRWLLERDHWDLAVTVFAETHRGGHLLWPDGDRVPDDALLDVYRAIDAAIGELLSAIDRDTTTIAVFSLHGMRASATQEHFVPAIVSRVNARFGGGPTPHDTAPRRRSGALARLRELLPPGLQAAIAHHLPARVQDWVVERALLAGVDWHTTPCFALPSSGESYLRFNLAGRERDGCLPRDGAEHARYRQVLRDELMALREVGSERALVDDVVFVADRYAGAAVDLLPDAVVLWSDVAPAAAIGSPALGEMRGRFSTGRTGEHRPEGFAVVRGPRSDLVPALRSPTDFAAFARTALGLTSGTRATAARQGDR